MIFALVLTEQKSAQFELGCVVLLSFGDFGNDRLLQLEKVCEFTIAHVWTCSMILFIMKTILVLFLEHGFHDAAQVEVYELLVG